MKQKVKAEIETLDTNSKEVRNALVKVADDVNQQRKNELMKLFFQTTAWTNWIAQQRALGQQKSKSKVWRKVASYPVEVDQFFSKIYGKNYYKDPEFFNKYAPEWRVYDHD